MSYQTVEGSDTQTKPRSQTMTLVDDEKTRLQTCVTAALQKQRDRLDTAENQLLRDVRNSIDLDQEKVIKVYNSPFTAQRIVDIIQSAGIEEFTVKIARDNRSSCACCSCLLPFWYCGPDKPLQGGCCYHTVNEDARCCMIGNCRCCPSTNDCCICVLCDYRYTIKIITIDWPAELQRRRTNRANRR